MTDENNSNNSDSENAKTSGENKESQNEANSQEGEGKEKKISTQIPKKRFDEVNEKYKAANKELEEFRAAKKEEEETKLKKDGEFQELLKLRDKEFSETKSLLEKERRNNKLEKFKNKSLNLLNKEGVIDGEDGLKFLSFDRLLDAENGDGIDDAIKNMVSDLKQNKSYLFGSSNQKRSTDENFMPGGGNQANNKSDSPKDAFSQEFARTYQK